MTEFSYFSCFMSASKTGLISWPAQQDKNWQSFGLNTTKQCIHTLKVFPVQKGHEVKNTPEASRADEDGIKKKAVARK